MAAAAAAAPPPPPPPPFPQLQSPAAKAVLPSSSTPRLSCVTTAISLQVHPAPAPTEWPRASSIGSATTATSRATDVEPPQLLHTERTIPAVSELATEETTSNNAEQSASARHRKRMIAIT